MLKCALPKVLLLSLLLSSGLLSAKDIQYVSDQLTIPMRSGTTTSHKILKFLNSGTALDVLEINAEKTHARVALLEDEDKSGWVETRLIMPEPSAREQLVAVKKKNQSLKDKRSELKKELNDLNAQNSNLQKVQGQLEDKIQSLNDTLVRL